MKQIQGLVRPAGHQVLLVAQYQADLVPVLEKVINKEAAIESARSNLCVASSGATVKMASVIDRRFSASVSLSMSFAVRAVVIQ